MAVSCCSKTTLVCDERGLLHMFGSDATTDTKPGTITIVESELSPHKIVMVSHGRGHKACITAGGLLLTWGTSQHGELGHGDHESKPRPHIIPRDTLGGVSALQVSCGLNHTMVLTAGHVVLSCGWGWYGQLGHGNTYDYHVLTQIELANIAMVACGGTSSMAVDTQGQVFSWGNNHDGQLGHNDLIQRMIPTPLSSETFANEAVELVSMGKFHAAAVTTKGTLYVWGSNASGQLGMDSSADSMKPQILPGFKDSAVSIVECCAAHTMVVLRNGTLWTFGILKPALGHGKNTGWPTLVDPSHFGDSKIVAVSGCEWHSTAVTERGDVYTWGVSIALGHPDGEYKWVPTLVNPALLLGARVGCFHDIREEHALAFVMCVHARLGEDCIFMRLDDGVIQSIIELCMSRPQGVLRQLPGLVRVMGGGLMLP